MSRGSHVSDTSPSGGKGLTLSAQAEKINALFGEFKGLRAQFTEFRKQIVSASEMKAMKEEMKQVRGEIAAARDAGAVVRQCQQAMEQQSAQQVQIRQQLEMIAPMARTAQGVTQTLQQDVKTLQKQVEPVSQQLRNLQEQAGGASSMMKEQAALWRKNEDAMQMLQRLQGAVQEVSQWMKSLDSSQGQVLEARREVERLRQEHGLMKQRGDEVVAKVQEAIRAAETARTESKHSVEQLRTEVTSIKNESQGAKGLHKEQAAHVRRLEERTRGLDELGRLKATVDTTGSEFWILKKQLYDSGVLAPKKEPEPEKLPVGTLELGEDVFTARLLIRLGLLKAQADKEKELTSADDDIIMELASEDSSGDEFRTPLAGGGCGLIEGFEEDVTGLAVPEIDADGRGQWLVTVGWVLVCIATLLVQVLIVGIMLFYGIDAGDECIKKDELSRWKWYMLHVSKAAATLAAGMLMGKELMDIVNFWMVSELLETKTSLEVVISAVTRILLILFIAAANVVIFMTMTSPADVWINMTALGFIGELSCAVLDVAKKGVFGHHICKAVTSVNYSLNFMTDYPWWFAYARALALSIATLFIICFAVILYIMPDNICLPDGTSQASNLLDRVVRVVTR